MALEFEQEGRGPIEIFQQIPEHLHSLLVPGASPLLAMNEDFRIVMEQFHGEGFEAWYSRYLIHRPVTLKARGDMSTLELRIALRNQIQGTWDTINNPALPEDHFQLSFAPHVLTNATFTPGDYSSFDIHFDFSFLSTFGLDYGKLYTFLDLVDKGQPAELSPYPHRCTPMMSTSVHHILHNQFSLPGKANLLYGCVCTILTAALEAVHFELPYQLPLSQTDIDALHYVKQIIDQEFPDHLHVKLLAHKAALNSSKLISGFRQLFGHTPYDYYQELRFKQAEVLLLRGMRVREVSDALLYRADSFIKEFGKRYGCSPKQWQLYHGVK